MNKTSTPKKAPETPLRLNLLSQAIRHVLATRARQARYEQWQKELVEQAEKLKEAVISPPAETPA